MAKSYTCSSLVKYCTWSTSANDTATLMKKIVAHAGIQARSSTINSR